MLKKIKDKVVDVVLSFLHLVGDLVVACYDLVMHIVHCVYVFVRDDVVEPIIMFVKGVFK